MCSAMDRLAAWLRNRANGAGASSGAVLDAITTRALIARSSRRLPSCHLRAHSPHLASTEMKLGHVSMHAGGSRETTGD